MEDSVSPETPRIRSTSLDEGSKRWCRKEILVNEFILNSLQNTASTQEEPRSNLDTFKGLVNSLYDKIDLLDEHIRFLKLEINEKNNTIDNLLTILNKVTLQVHKLDSYNEDVDEYNKDVSNHNTTPTTVPDNVTYRRKVSSPKKQRGNVNITNIIQAMCHRPEPLCCLR